MHGAEKKTHGARKDSGLICVAVMDLKTDQWRGLSRENLWEGRVGRLSVLCEATDLFALT